MEPERPVTNTGDLLNLLDRLLQRGDDAWWNDLFADREKPCPFFVDLPDETLFADFAAGLIQPGKVLELGCGNGRNATYMASLGCIVHAVDFSSAAIDWAKQRTQAAGSPVNYIHKSIFDLDVPPSTYDLIYDSGCFHHIPPHRREGYLKLVTTALKPAGALSMTCFTPEGGSGLSDLDVYEERTLGGGLGYSEWSLREIFGSAFDILSLRRMQEMQPSDQRFGKDVLWALRMAKREPK